MSTRPSMLLHQLTSGFAETQSRCDERPEQSEDRTARANRDLAVVEFDRSPIPEPIIDDNVDQRHLRRAEKLFDDRPDLPEREHVEGDVQKAVVHERCRECAPPFAVLDVRPVKRAVLYETARARRGVMRVRPHEHEDVRDDEYPCQHDLEFGDRELFCEIERDRLAASIVRDRDRAAERRFLDDFDCRAALQADVREIFQ